MEYIIEQLNYIFTRISFLHLNILLLLGLALFGGTIGGRLFQKIRIPQVVGYISIGILVGQSGLNIINRDIIMTLQPFNFFALGLIGFMIGGELKKDVLRRHGKQFAFILLSEGFISFLAVFLSVGFLGSLFFEGGIHFWAVGLLLGAIASATAPAATTDVLWEHKTRGPLTTTVLGIVGMDDGLALILFAIASSIASRILGQNTETIIQTIIHPIYEIGGAIVIGGIAGLSLTKLIKKYSQKERMLAFSIGAVLLVLGLSLAINVDMLLAAMTLGIVVVNRAPRISREVFNLVAGFAAPIYVLFFVLVGAKFDLHNITSTVILIAVIYLIARTTGKMVGASFGARISAAPETVKKYLPFCLFSQAGVAIGLSIVAYHAFPGEIGNLIVIVITTSTFVVQLIGPSSVKYAVIKAGEVGLNITEEDLMRQVFVADAMDKKPPVIYKNTPLKAILKIFSDSDYLYYPVIDAENKLTGVITVESIKQTFMYADTANLFLADDIMEPVRIKISADASLLEASDLFEKYNLDYLPVVTDELKITGFLERRILNKFISTKIIEAEEKAKSLG